MAVGPTGKEDAIDLGMNAKLGCQGEATPGADLREGNMTRVATYALIGLLAAPVVAGPALGATIEKKTTTTTERRVVPDGRTATGTHALSVRQVQQDLRAAGYYRGPIDGRMGPRTSQALKDFQHAKGLQITGRLDSRTERALMAAG